MFVPSGLKTTDINTRDASIPRIYIYEKYRDTYNAADFLVYDTEESKIYVLDIYSDISTYPSSAVTFKIYTAT